MHKTRNSISQGKETPISITISPVFITKSIFIGILTIIMRAYFYIKTLRLMIAMITNGLSPAAAVQYNEKKVTGGRANALLAMNFGADMADLSFEMKVRLLEKRAALNPQVRTRCLHITPGFGDSERPEPHKVWGRRAKFQRSPPAQNTHKAPILRPGPFPEPHT
jgi:hypothetical protein